MPAAQSFRNARRTAFAVSLAGLLTVCQAAFVAGSARAEGPAVSAAAAVEDIENTLGGVPSFLKAFPNAALPGAWSELKAVEFSDQTALPPKVKALIGVAVAAQIPCQYCVWADTQTARQFGATDEEIAEAVTVAALTRHWSTFFYGMQVDLETFKQELGGETAAK